MIRLTCLGLQRLDRLGHGQVGLAGPGRADGEHDRVLVDRVRVALLVQRLGPDGAAAGGQDADGQHVGRAHAALGAQHGRGALHRVGGQVGALAQQLDELGEQVRDEGGFRRAAGRGDLVAADMDVGGKVPLDHVQELIARAQQADHGMISGHHDLDLRLRLARQVARGLSRPARCRWGRFCRAGYRSGYLSIRRQFDAFGELGGPPPERAALHVIWPGRPARAIPAEPGPAVFDWPQAIL